MNKPATATVKTSASVTLVHHHGTAVAAHVDEGPQQTVGPAAEQLTAEHAATGLGRLPTEERAVPGLLEVE